MPNGLGKFSLFKDLKHEIMNYAIELLEEQQKLLMQEMEFTEGEERTETTRRLVDVGNTLNKLNLPVVVQQRELLKAFLEHIEDTIDFLPCEPSELIDDYFESLL